MPHRRLLHLHHHQRLIVEQHRVEAVEAGENSVDDALRGDARRQRPYSSPAGLRRRPQMGSSPTKPHMLSFRSEAPAH
jgi:hypothetical protein